MKTIFYKKVGRKYVPVSEYDSELIDALPKGTHLIHVDHWGKSRRYNIDPNYAAMIAAGYVAERAVSEAIMKATEIRLQRCDRERKLTKRQKLAWENLIKEFGDTAKQLEWPSTYEASQEAVKAMIKEADKLMQNESVKKAFDHFQLMCKLATTNEKN